jgi:hypothetical protein
MSTSCSPPPANKKEYLSDIGKILVKDYGKKKYYKPEEVKKAHKKSKWNDGVDFSCWGMSTFSSHSDFTDYHQQTGEQCDYTEMKSTMLQGLSLSESVVLNAPDNETSWLDLSDLYEGILDGIGEFISGITDGL